MNIFIRNIIKLDNIFQFRGWKIEKIIKNKIKGVKKIKYICWEIISKGWKYNEI